MDDFNFFPIEEDDHTQIKQVEEQQEPATPPISPASTTYGDSPPSFLNERIEERIRSLRDLYEVTERHDNLILFCLYADYKPVNFQETALDEKWRIAMDEEIKAYYSSQRSQGNQCQMRVQNEKKCEGRN